jgi:hypothetical protein
LNSSRSRRSTSATRGSPARFSNSSGKRTSFAQACSACRRAPGELAVELVEHQLDARLDLDVLEDDERVARLHAAAVAHQDVADDAALLVLDRAAIHVHLHRAGRDHRAAHRRERRPDGDGEHEQRHGAEAGEDELPRAVQLVGHGG